MKGLLEGDTLARLVEVRRPMEPLAEKDQFWLVGGVRLMKSRPHFHYGFGGTLTKESAFRKHRFSVPESGSEGFALILRGFLHPDGVPEEFFAGWVPLTAESDLDGWISFLNRQIDQRLAGISYDADRAQVSMASSIGEPLARSPSSPTTPAVPRVTSEPSDAHRVADRTGHHHASLEAVRQQGLVPVGFFRELGNEEADAPSVVQARGRRALAHKAEVVAYLRGGELVIAWMGGDEDYFSPGTFFGPEHISGDGVYAWPIALAAYVEFYDVELPAEFEEHMRQRAWRPISNLGGRGW
jgi:hypothetical protein